MRETLRMGEAQSIHSSWEAPRLRERTPASRIERFREEANELLEYAEVEDLNEKAKNPDYAREVGFEAIDCVILCLGVIDSLGLNAENLFLEKMEKNYQKYQEGYIDEL